jgi:hypothetical protein
MIAPIMTQMAIAMCAVAGEFLSAMQVAQAKTSAADEAQARSVMRRILDFI